MFKQIFPVVDAGVPGPLAGLAVPQDELGFDDVVLFEDVCVAGVLDEAVDELDGIFDKPV